MVVLLAGRGGADDGVVGLAVGEIVAGDTVAAVGEDVAGEEGALVDDGAFVVEPGPRAVGGDLDGVAGQGRGGRRGVGIADEPALEPGALAPVGDGAVSIIRIQQEGALGGGGDVADEAEVLVAVGAGFAAQAEVEDAVGGRDGGEQFQRVGGEAGADPPGFGRDGEVGDVNAVAPAGHEAGDGGDERGGVAHAAVGVFLKDLAVVADVEAEAGASAPERAVGEAGVGGVLGEERRRGAGDGGGVGGVDVHENARRQVGRRGEGGQEQTDEETGAVGDHGKERGTCDQRRTGLRIGGRGLGAEEAGSVGAEVVASGASGAGGATGVRGSPRRPRTRVE